MRSQRSCQQHEQQGWGGGAERLITTGATQLDEPARLLTTGKTIVEDKRNSAGGGRKAVNNRSNSSGGTREVFLQHENPCWRGEGL